MSEFDAFEKKQERLLLRKADRLQARPKRVIAFNAAVLGVYGWHVSVPVLLGVFLGRFMDNRFPVLNISWTLNFILIGFLAGIYNANRWLKKEGVVTSPHRLNDKNGTLALRSGDARRARKNKKTDCAFSSKRRGACKS